MDNKEIATVLDEIGFLLEVKGENPFKSRAYQQASRIIEGLESPVHALLEDLKAGKVKGIGSGLSEKSFQVNTSIRKPINPLLQFT
ncbi:MAG: helix-hairpin-helix domain-containing protein, partial [Patescibacteria group bacterium]|nr:helix-hairpin-helix domain-containing protein [Patescibacteria group bacterium]